MEEYIDQISKMILYQLMDLFQEEDQKMLYYYSFNERLTVLLILLEISKNLRDFCPKQQLIEETKDNYRKDVEEREKERQKRNEWINQESKLKKERLHRILIEIVLTIFVSIIFSLLITYLLRK